MSTLKQMLSEMKCDHAHDVARSMAYGEGYDEGWHECYNAVADWIEKNAIGGAKEKLILPHPCDGELYKDVGHAEQMMKIYDEYLETKRAFLRYLISNLPSDRHSVAHELTDMIVACTTMLDKLGYDEKARQALLYEINMSNKLRDHGKRFKEGGAK